MPFTSLTGYRARCRLAGLRRAAFWRELGFPNLKLANAARRLNAARRREDKARLRALAQNPFALVALPRRRHRVLDRMRRLVGV